MTRSRLRPAAAALALAAPLAIGTSSSAATTASARPTYRAYDLGMTGGEPGIGYVPKADAAIYSSVGGRTTVNTRRLTWNDATSPAKIAVAAPARARG